MNAYLKTELKLKRALWNQEARKSILNRAITKSAQGLEEKLLKNIDESTPAGRLYLKRLVTERKSSLTKDFRSKRGTKTRVVTGRETYRASQKGQPPAKRFGTLYRNLKVRRVVGKLQMTASVKAPGVEYLDSPNYFDRPFFATIVNDYYQNEFQEEVRISVEELNSELN